VDKVRKSPWIKDWISIGIKVKITWAEKEGVL
jgi:hypothetical protein